MQIYVKKEFTITGRFNQQSELEKFDFTISNDDGTTTHAILYPNLGKVESYSKIEIPDNLFECLQTGKCQGIDLFDNEGRIKTDIDPDIFHIFNQNAHVMQYQIEKATRKLIFYIKIWLFHTELEEIKDNMMIKWSADGKIWKEFNIIGIISAMDIVIFSKLNKNHFNMIQKCLDNNIEPFIALEFLQKAINDSDSRHKWIYATIAAELAIKEFLMKKNPILEVLLNEVPSPPLDKLYGKILKEYCGIEPYMKIKDIQYGVKIRNLLVLRPRDIDLDAQDTYIYVRLIEATIFQFLSNLYPEIAPIVSDHYPPVMKYIELEQSSRI